MLREYLDIIYAIIAPWHSVIFSQLQHSLFKPELELLSLWSISCSYWMHTGFLWVTIVCVCVCRWGPCGGAGPYAGREDAWWGATVGRSSALLLADGGWVVYIVSAGRWPHARHSHDTRAEDHLRLCHLPLRLPLHADCALLPYPTGPLPQYAHLHLGWWSRRPWERPIWLHTGIVETHTNTKTLTRLWLDTPS